MKVVAVVLARLDSRRLPQKALRMVRGRALVDYVLDACAVDGVDEVVLATTDRAVDDPLVAHAERRGTVVFRGDETDVAGRFLGALQSARADAAVRVNGDSPLHRGALLQAGVALWRTHRPDLVTNVPGRSWPFGWSVEVVARAAMEKACAAMVEPAHREHVTKYFYDALADHQVVSLPPGPVGGAGLQLAVDNEQDLARFAHLAELLGDRISTATPATIIDAARRYEAEHG